MIYFIYGPNTFTARKKMRAIIDRFLSTGRAAFEVSRFVGGEHTFDDVRAQALNASLFAETSFFILENLFYEQKITKSAIESVRMFAERPDVVVIYEENLLPEDAWTTFLQSIATRTQHANALSSRELILWICAYAGKFGLALSAQDAKRLSGKVGNDQWQLSGEIEKLSLSADKKPAAFTSCAPADARRTLFSFGDAIKQKSYRDAFVWMHAAIVKNASVEDLVRHLMWEYKTILTLKRGRGQTPKDTKLHPFVIQKTLPYAESFSEAELQDALLALSKLFVEVKFNSADALYKLEALVLQD